MIPNHFSNFLHGFNFRTHDSSAPFFHELLCPGWGSIFPEALEIFSEEVGPDSLEIVTQELLELDSLFISEIFWPFEEAPARMLQDLFVAVLLKPSGLLRSNLVDSFIHLAHEVKTIQDVYCRRSLLSNDLEVWLPHIATDKSESARALLPEHTEEAKKTLFSPIWSNPEESLEPFVNLVNQGEVLVPPLPLNLIDANGLNAFKRAMLESPLDGHGYRAIDGFPRCPKDRGDLFPGEPLGPAGQEPLESDGQRTLAIRPGNDLDLDAAALTVNSPFGVDEKNSQSPKGNILETTLGQAIVARRNLAAARANWLGIFPGSDLHMDVLPGGGGRPVGFGVNKRLVFFDSIEDSCNLHPGFPPLVVYLENSISLKRKTGCIFFGENQEPNCQLWGGQGEGLGEPAPGAQELVLPTAGEARKRENSSCEARDLYSPKNAYKLRINTQVKFFSHKLC